MTHLPHGMKELRYADVSEPGMKSCQDCERRMTVQNGVGGVQCCEGIISGVIFHNQGCSLMNCVRNNSRVLFVTPGSKLAFQPMEDFCDNCNRPIDNETNQDEQCEKCGKKICSSCCVLDGMFKVLCAECDNPAANKDKDDSLSSLQPGDYMETEKDHFRIITEVTSSRVNYIRLIVGDNRVSRSSVPAEDFFEDMAYYGITEKDGSIFDVGFKFYSNFSGRDGTIIACCEETVEFNTGVSTKKADILHRIIISSWVPQFNSNKEPEIKAGDIYKDNMFQYFIKSVDQNTNKVEYDAIDIKGGRALKNLWLDGKSFLSDIKNGLIKKIN